MLLLGIAGSRGLPALVVDFLGIAGGGGGGTSAAGAGGGGGC